MSAFEHTFAFRQLFVQETVHQRQTVNCNVDQALEHIEFVNVYGQEAFLKVQEVEEEDRTSLAEGIEE